MTRKKTARKIQEYGAEYKRWKHPGGKLRELGPKALSTEELLAILISTGYKGKCHSILQRRQYRNTVDSNLYPTASSVIPDAQH